MGTGKKVIIDIGHARGTGARGNGIGEHERCERIGAELAELLRAGGIEAVVLDYPDKSNRADLEATARAANSAQGVAFGLSLHMDASSNPAACGAHVCYASAAGERVARALAGPLCELLPGRAEGVVRRRDLYILNRTRAPWALAECGFVTHAGDAGAPPAAVARALAAGVAAYFGQGGAA